MNRKGEVKLKVLPSLKQDKLQKMQSELNSLITVTDQQLIKAIGLADETGLKSLPIELVRAKAVCMKISRFLTLKNMQIQGIENLFMQDSIELPTIKSICPNSYSELLDIAKWILNETVRGEVSQSLINQVIKLTDTFIAGERMKTK